MTPIRTALGILALPLALAAPVAAQDLSVQEILQRLEAQAEVLSRTGADGELGASRGLGGDRGLEFVTLDDAAPAPARTGATVTADAAAETPARTAPAEDAPVVLARFAPDLQVNLQISFAFDSAAIEADQGPVLDTMCQVLREGDLGLVRIVGHTDSSGTADYNDRLSRLRAEEVARHLVDECGVAASRLETMGVGERFPLDAADPTADANRRVEFQALS